MGNLSNINNKFIVVDDGNVLIGATSTYPQGNNTILKLYSPSIPRFYLQNTTTGSNVTDGSQFYVSGSDLYITNSESANIILSTGATPRMTIDGSGNVGINETSPSSYFSPDLVVKAKADLGGITIRSNATTDNNYLMFADGTSGNTQYRGYVNYNHSADSMTFGSGAVARMTIDSSGNVSIKDGKKLYLNNSVNTASGSIVCPGGGSLVLQSYGNDMIYLNENAEIRFSTSSSERMRIDSSGHILMGKTSGSYRLDMETVAGGNAFRTTRGTSSYRIFQANNGASYMGTENDADLNIQTNSATRVTIDNSGNVGIGTSSPTVKLHVQGATNDGIAVMGVGTTATRVFAGLNGSNHGYLFATGSSGQSPSLINSAGGDSYISGGKLGIGITSPSTILHIDAGQTSAGNLTNNVAVYIGGAFVNNDLYHREGGLLVISGTNATQTSAGIAFQTRNTGNTNYWKSSILMNRNGELEFYTGGAGTGQGSKRIVITSGGNFKVIDGITELTRGSNGNQLALLTHTGTVPYGMQIRYTGASPNTTDNYFFLGSDSSANRIIIWGNGNIQNQNNSYGGISDLKLKENIVDATPKLDDLMKVKIRNYNFIGQKDKQIGVIAQEIENVFPNLVEDTKDPENEETTKSVKYSVLVPIMLKAIQELEARVKELENR